MKSIQNRAVCFSLCCAITLCAFSNALAQSATSGGVWSEKIDTPVIAVAAANLPTGKVLMWSSNMQTTFGAGPAETYTAIFDPITRTSTQRIVRESQHDMFCPGISLLDDGRLLISGGNSAGSTSIYSAETDNSSVWQRAEDLNIPRGYHSSAITPSGAVFTIGGSWSGGIGGKMGEIWHEGRGWFPLSGLPGSLLQEGTNDPEGVYREDNHAWIFAAPGERMFHAGPGTAMHWLDLNGNGSYTSAGTRADDEYSMNGSVAMYDIGKILKAGGAPAYAYERTANANSYIIDVNGAQPSVQRVANMKYPRTLGNSVVLPNGEVMVIGGIPIATPFSDQFSVMIPEIFNPDTQTWRDAASIQVPRNYHSTALLLPDGRVMAAGGGQCGDCDTNHFDTQIYSPEYLFTANGQPRQRPTITNAPAKADYGQTISVSSNGNVDHYVLMRLSSVTHSINTDQRRVPLATRNTGNGNFQLSIPTDRGIAPPGLYMLFAMDANGTPSISRNIQIGSATATPEVNLPDRDLGAMAVLNRGNWRIDSNRDTRWNGNECVLDDCGQFGSPTDVAVPGIEGATVGVYRPKRRRFFFDLNNNLSWDGCTVDLCIDTVGREGDLPVIKDGKIGVFRPKNGRWFFDKNGNHRIERCRIDECGHFGGLNDIPLIRNGNVGVFRASTKEWFFDANGNIGFDGCHIDHCVVGFGEVGDKPVVNPVTGVIGVYRPSQNTWFLDSNNNLQWDGCSVDSCINTFGNGNVQALMVELPDPSAPSFGAALPIGLPEGVEAGITNAVGVVSLDGEINEWESLTAFPRDSENNLAASENPLDWDQAWMAHDAQHFYLAYSNQSSIVRSWGQSVLIDSDYDSDTGFNQSSAIGADFLIQANELYAHIGENSEWQWAHVATLNVGESDRFFEMAIPRELLGNTAHLRFYFLGSNDPYSSSAEVDLYPNGAHDANASERFFTYSVNTGEENTAPDVVSSQVTTLEALPTNILLQGSDVDNNPLEFTITRQPEFGRLEGVAPEVTYTAENYEGRDSFSFVVSDGTQQSAEAVVNINVLGSYLSNPVENLSINGEFSDWAEVESFTQDEIGELRGSNNPIDLQSAWMAHDDDNLYLSFENADSSAPLPVEGINAFLDTDRVVNSGYRFNSSMGADFLIQGAQLFQYIGNGHSWDWQLIEIGSSEVRNNRVELMLSRTAIHNVINMKVIFTADNVALGGESDDFMPGDARQNVGINYLNYSFGPSLLEQGLGAALLALDSNVNATNGTLDRVAQARTPSAINELGVNRNVLVGSGCSVSAGLSGSSGDVGLLFLVLFSLGFCGRKTARTAP